jgi:ribosomal protein L11 methyltransferase
MDWLELSVEVDPEAVEAVSELFSRYGYNGGVVIEQDVVPLDGEPVDWGALTQPGLNPTEPVIVRTYVPDDAQAPAIRRQIEEALWHLSQMRPIGTLQVERRQEQEWANAWKAYYSVMRVGRRTVIKPSWLEYSPQQGDVVVELDPGMAFGTGLHPTTRLCLAALEDYVRPNMNVLDLGTGSGILAIAAAKLGGPSVWVTAVDTDPVAVEAARQNVARNGLASQISVDQGSTDAARGQGPYSLIVANILAGVIIDLARSLYHLLERGGVLIASGIFVDRGDAVVEALAKVGLSVRERRQEGDWLCLVCVRER